MKSSKKRSVARVVFNLAVDKEFDYRIPSGATVREGMRVWGQFGRSTRVGIVVELVGRSLQKEINPILEVLDRKNPSLSKNHILFARRLAKIYPFSRGEFLFMTLPRKLRSRKNVCEMEAVVKTACAPGPPADSPYSGVEADSPQERLDIYRDVIRRGLESGSVMVCFPLIASLQYAAAHYADEFKEDILTFHSRQKETELIARWRAARQGKKLVLTTRMGLFFYPLDLNTIIVDDESNEHYLSQEKPYYNLIEVARILAGVTSSRLILGFDYPSLRTYELFQKENLPRIRRPHSQCGVEIIQSLSFFTKKRRGLEFNRLFLELVRKNLDAKKRVLILYNRQGFASLLKCSHCGYVYRCSRCSGTLKFSSSKNQGVCPWCHRTHDIPSVCPECQSGYIKSHGVGIERLTEKIKSAFGDVTVALLRDEFSDARVLVSTYALMEKPFFGQLQVDTAFVLDADHYLARIDFQASQELYIYLRRLGARVKERVYIFTRNSGHYLWPALTADTDEFYRAEGKFRKEAHLPPYRSFAKISLRGRDQKKLLIKADTVYNNLHTVKGFEVFGPIEDVPFKLRGYYYYSVIVKSRKKEQLHRTVDQLARKFRKGAAKIAIHVQ